MARRRQVVLDPPAVAVAPGDQVLGGEPVGERSKRLVALKRLDREQVRGGARIAADGTKRVPLGERRPGSCQPRVERSMVPVLDLLYSTSECLEICRHPKSIQLTKATYINILR